SIYDIDVLVDSFDYSLLERSYLKLSAELTISGLYDAQAQELPQEYEVLNRFDPQEVPEEFEPVQEESFLFEAEARKQEEEESVVAYPKFPTFTYQAKQEEEPSWGYEEPRSEENHHPEVFFVEDVVTAHEEPNHHVHIEEELAVVEES